MPYNQYLIKINALIDIYLIKDKLDKLNYYDKGAVDCISFWSYGPNDFKFNMIVDTTNKDYFATRGSHKHKIKTGEVKRIDLFEFLKL